MIKIKSIAVIAIFLVLTGCFPSSDLAKKELLLQGRTMGTTYNIKIVVENESLDVTKLQAKIDKLLKQVNQEMSTYIPDSELSLFNKSQSTDPIEISVGLQKVLAEAIRLGQISEGKLDVTSGAVINLWGFGPELRPEKVPTDEQITKAKANIGISKLMLAGNMLSKSIPNLYIDLSTIAKGYGVDLVADLIAEQGISNYIVEIGGEMRLNGFKNTGELWHVAIEKPITEQRVVHQLIIPKNNALATSGDYRIFFEVDGQRFSHIIDPDTGKPINHKLVSVTVIHPSSMTADGLSTAMMVMGEEKAMEFAEKYDLAALFLFKTEDGFDERFTVKFKQYFK
ncbi:MAG: FAD:protein FMN transferase [Alteromonadaceae bacterium]|nr:FAD:protein FMN transferase [Alteromonadaceae bacterium]